MAQVQFQDVSKRYGGTEVVKSFSLDTQDGEFVVLVGPSGCGKSTTLRMIAGLEEISGGAVYIGGRRVNDVPPKDRNIAMVFQNYALYPHKDVYANLAFGLKMRRKPRTEIDRRVRTVAKTLGIEPLLRRKPGQLSGGQRQRVALGRAIVREPSVFLMDEPLSNLDAQLRVSMRSEIAKLHRELRVTTFYVTHDQIEALTLGDRVVVMNEGAVQQISTPATLYDAPVNRFVARFIGSPAMNLLNCRITESGRCLSGNGVEVRLDPVQADRLRAASGDRVWLGLRSEHLEMAEGDARGRGGSWISGRVDLVEHLGAVVEIELTLPGDEHVVVQLDRRKRVAVGDTITLDVDATAVHAFDQDSERNLMLPPPRSPPGTA